jgi:ABC-2 type transport system ATP-binding protein
MKNIIDSNSIPAIEIQSLTKSFKGRIVLKELTCKINTGTITGLVGSNGAGKTTLMKLLLSLVTPTSGEIKIFGHNTVADKEYLKKTGAMIENPVFYEELTAIRNLEIIAHYTGSEIKYLPTLLEKVNLLEHANEKVGKFSLGMKQRLGLISAFVNKPRLVILDEPTNGLDPDNIESVRNFLLEQNQLGVTLLISSHLLDELELISTNFIFMEEGLIKFNGSKAELFADRSELTLAQKYFELKNVKKVA